MIRIYRLVFLLLVLFISYAAVTPVEGGASVPYIDKLLHFVAFLILTFFMDLSIKKPLLLSKAALILLILYAFLIELVQYFLSYDLQRFSISSRIYWEYLFIYISPQK